jgi:hypothetical protein
MRRAHGGLIARILSIVGLRRAGENQWANRSIFSPDDGNIYRVRAKLRSAGIVVARIYRARASFDADRMFMPAPRSDLASWC